MATATRRATTATLVLRGVAKSERRPAKVRPAPAHEMFEEEAEIRAALLVRVRR